MAEAIVQTQTPTEYFRELVESAMQNQHVSAHELTSYYVVNLLTAFVRGDSSPGHTDEALGVTFAEAMQTAGVAHREGLRKVGDLSLFTSGFFADSLNRKLVDVDYYILLGGHAYRSLARQEDEALSDVFDELSDKFTIFVDILGEVSERTALASNGDVLRLYEKWLRTRSPRCGELLASRGIVPNGSVGSRFIQ